MGGVSVEGWITVSQIVSGPRRLLIQKREESERFRFLVERYFGPAEEDEGTWPNGFWAPEHGSASGYYGSAKEAEAAAQSEAGWQIEISN
jgi:hypothetical protein